MSSHYGNLWLSKHVGSGQNKKFIPCNAYGWEENLCSYLDIHIFRIYFLYYVVAPF
jgi:hypothetical protein